jgi:hypothetical protein
MIGRLVFGVGLATAALSAGAAEFGQSVRLGATYSDNALRSPSGNEIGSGTVFLGVQAVNAKTEGRLRYDLSADLAYYEYLNVDVDQNLQGRMTAQGTYDFVPDIFSWNAGFEYDQIRDDLAAPVTANNLEAVERFWTGPTLHARLSQQMQAMLSAHYAAINYGDRNTDNHTVGGRVELTRQSSPTLSIGPGFSYDHTSYPTDPQLGSSDFDRQEAFLRVDYRGQRTSLGMDAGYAWLKSGEAQDDGPLLRANFSRQLTPTLLLTLQGAREFSITDGYGYGMQPYSAGGLNDNSILTGGARITTRIDLGLRYERARTGWELAWSKRKEDAGETGAGTRHYDELRGRLTRRMTPSLTGALYAVWSDEDVSESESAFTASESYYGANLDYAFGRTLWLSAWVEGRDRQHSGNFSEFSGGLSLSYGKRHQGTNSGPMRQ